MAAAPANTPRRRLLMLDDLASAHETSVRAPLAFEATDGTDGKEGWLGGGAPRFSTP